MNLDKELEKMFGIDKKAHVLDLSDVSENEPDSIMNSFLKIDQSSLVKKYSRPNSQSMARDQLNSLKQIVSVKKDQKDNDLLANSNEKLSNINEGEHKKSNDKFLFSDNKRNPLKPMNEK